MVHKLEASGCLSEESAELILSKIDDCIQLEESFEAIFSKLDESIDRETLQHQQVKSLKSPTLKPKP